MWKYDNIISCACRDMWFVSCYSKTYSLPLECILKMGQSSPCLSLSPGRFEKREHLLFYYKTKRLNISWKCTFNKTDIKFFGISRTWLFFFIKKKYIQANIVLNSNMYTKPCLNYKTRHSMNVFFYFSQNILGNIVSNFCKR